MKPAYASFCCDRAKLSFWRVVSCSSCWRAVYQPDPTAITPTTNATKVLARASQNSFDRFSFLAGTSSLGGAEDVSSPFDGPSPVGDVVPEDVPSCAGVGSSTRSTVLEGGGSRAGSGAVSPPGSLGQGAPAACRSLVAHRATFPAGFPAGQAFVLDRADQMSPVASNTQLVSALARSANQVGGAWAVMLPMSQ